MLTKLYYLKKLILQLECYKDSQQFPDTQFALFQKEHGECSSFFGWDRQIDEFQHDFIEKHLPLDIREEWEYSDYTAYTDKFHHRKFWNEIEDCNAVSYFLKKFFELARISTVETDTMNYCLYLYDFNNFAIYFEDENALNAFIEAEDVAPCTCFERKGDDFVETWSM